MELEFGGQEQKIDVLKETETYLGRLALNIESIDGERPWGGFFVIAQDSVDKFINTYFPDLDREQIEKYGANLSPKILIVEPGQKLSWQYHNRRAELWRVVSGPVGVVTSLSDTEGQLQTLSTGETIQFDAQTRHRLVGLNQWGVVAEIWQHTDSNQPSDEEDIIRLSDNYGRAN